MDVAAEHDVVVLGAGPAGAAAAIRLAEMGLDVGMVERQYFPREHVGICLSEATVALIDHLGVGVAFDEAKFWRRNLTAVRWEEAETRFVPQPGYHVDRGVLDQILLWRSRSAGVKIYQPARIQEIGRSDSRGWRVRICSPEPCRLLKARFVVDAAGRRAAIRGLRVKDGPPLLTLYANWSLARAPEFDGLIEAGENAWLWYAQTAPNRAIVSIFCDPRRLAARPAPDVRYLELIRQFDGLQPTQLGQPCSAVRACDATSQHAADPIGDQYIRVGDACLTVDPLSSQGVYLALQSGLQGAVVVNTVLKKTENTEVAQQFFRMRASERVRRYGNRTRREYSRAMATRSNAFWHERAAGTSSVEADEYHHPLLISPESTDQVTVSPEVRFYATPVISGNYVEMRRAINHPGIEGNVAYVENVELTLLLSALPPSIAYSMIPMLWREFVPPAIARRIALWLWNKGILIKAI